MTTFLTSSRTPTKADLSAQCSLKKGLPIGWFREEPTVTFTDQGGGTIVGVITLGDWVYNECICAIDCSQVADVVITPPDPAPSDPEYANFVKTPTTKICPANDTLDFAARVASPSASVPTDFLLEFTDVFGNVVRRTFSFLRFLSLKEPSINVTTISDPGTESESGQKPDTIYATITVPFQAADTTDIESSVAAFQVQRYVGHAGVATTLQGWSDVDDPSNPTNEAWDYLLRVGKVYGYRVRYKSAIGDVSPWSPWETVTT